MRETKTLIGALKHTSGVHVNLIPYVSKRATSDEEAARWVSNIAALEAYIRKNLPGEEKSGTVMMGRTCRLLMHSLSMLGWQKYPLAET